MTKLAQTKSTLDVSRVISTARSCLSSTKEAFALHEPHFAGNEWKYVKECLDTGWVSTAGDFVNGFERALESFTGIPHAVAVINGTSALHIALRVVGCEVGEEVLVPDLTFVATANAVSYCGATPHFVDSESVSLGVCADKLRIYLEEIAEIRDGETFNKQTQKRIRALVVMHALGHPANLEKLAKLCSDYEIELVEDSAQALGSLYKERHIGHSGRVTALSFNGNKIMTTGGGGAILFHDEALAKRAKHLVTTARLAHPWKIEHDQIGYNYRLPNINAALGLAQLEQLPHFLEQKRLLADRYKKAFSHFEGLQFVDEPSYGKSNFWLSAVMLDEGVVAQKEELLQAFYDQNIFVRPFWTLMHKLPMYSNAPRMNVDCAESMENRIITLPSGVAAL